MIRIHFHIVLFCLALICCRAGLSQRLVPDSGFNLLLSDSTSVTLFRSVTTDGTDNACYYLPVGFRISEKAGKPEFSFLAYDSDGNGKNDGAILHLLLTWGLTENQEAETARMMTLKVDSTLFLAGSYFPGTEKGEVIFSIRGENPLCDVFKQSLRSQGSPPWSPGERMALSFMFSSDNSDRIKEAMENPEELKGLFFDLDFRIPGLSGSDVLLLRGDFRKWIINLGAGKKSL